MALQVCNGASLMCSLGLAPSSLVVLPTTRVNTGGQPDANIMANVPLVNIMPFGMCTSPSNPVVIAATAAKLGVFTPAACVPLTPAPWTPGAPTVLLGGQPALDSTATLACVWAGMITVASPGEVTVSVP
jgi:hypothetical protein